MREIVACLDEVASVAREILELIPDESILILNGDLASGKTTIVKAIAKLKGYESEVTSPTFSLEHIYSDRLFHYDLYRVDFEDLVSLGLINEFEREGLHLIEWADDSLKRLLLGAGFELFELNIKPKGSCRVYKIERLNA